MFRTSFTGLEGLAKGLEKDLAKAVTAGVRDATDLLKADVREETQVSLPGGNRLPKAWRSKVYPGSGDSADAAGVVSVRGSAAKLIDAFARGVTIRANGGRWLAVPTREAGRWGVKSGRSGFGTTVNSKGARERVTPAGFERRSGLKLRFVPGKGGRAFLVVDQAQLTRGIAVPYRSKGRGSRLYGPAGQTMVIFILVPQVKLKKRLDLDAVAEQAGARVPGLIVNRWRD